MRIKIFNIVTIGSLVIGIFLITACCFIGSQETFQGLLPDLPEHFMKRTAGGVVIGLLGCSIVTLGNFLLDRNKLSDRKQRLIKISLLTLLLSFISSLIGTTIFYSN